MKPLFFVLCVFLTSLSARAETVLFLFGGPTQWPFGDYGLLHWKNESFVVPVSDPVQIATLREYLARRGQGLEPRAMLARLRLALGSDTVNRNYSAPGAPLWDWHVAEVLEVGRAQGDLKTTKIRTDRDGPPSAMKKFLTGEAYTPHPTVPPGQPLPPPSPIVRLDYYPLQMELREGAPAKVINVSNRGYAGAGERTLITGFVIDGTTPRNVVIRALGPSLTQYGVIEALMDPTLELYRGNQRIAVNDTWILTSLNLSYPWNIHPALPDTPWAPSDPREPGFRLSLPPGSYTVLVRPEGNSSPGIALVEVYTTD